MLNFSMRLWASEGAKASLDFEMFRKKVGFLVLSGKKQTSILLVPRWKKSFYAHAWDVRHEFSPVATGGFGGLSPTKQSSKAPQIEIWNIIIKYSFCVQASLHKRLNPPAST